MITYRPAIDMDAKPLKSFVDYWLAGRGLKDCAAGSVNDYFVPEGRIADYIKRCNTMIAVDMFHIVGWAVTDKKGVLIHLLVAGDCRGQGIGTELLRTINPKIIRSKTDQSTGDPTDFYINHGYIIDENDLIGKNKNIQLLRKG